MNCCLFDFLFVFVTTMKHYTIPDVLLWLYNVFNSDTAYLRTHDICEYVCVCVRSRSAVIILWCQSAVSTFVSWLSFTCQLMSFCIHRTFHRHTFMSFISLCLVLLLRHIDLYWSLLEANFWGYVLCFVIWFSLIPRWLPSSLTHWSGHSSGKLFTDHVGQISNPASASLNPVETGAWFNCVAALKL